MKKTRSKSSGFTLLEVLMTTVILFFLSFSVFLSVRSTVNLKEDIDEKTSGLQTIRAVVGLLERDFQRTFFVRANDLGWNPKRNGEGPNEDQPEASEEGEEGTPNESGSAEATPSEDPPDATVGAELPLPEKPQSISIFQGERQRVFFSTATHQRVSLDAPENEHHFVTYSLERGKLFRSESPRAVSFSDREDPSSFRSIEVLDRVRKLDLEYYDPRSNKWVTRWDSDNRDTRDMVPAAVRVYIEFEPEDEALREKIGAHQIYTAFRISEDVFRNHPKNREENNQNQAREELPTR